jgi:hypothetical protein
MSAEAKLSPNWKLLSKNLTLCESSLSGRTLKLRLQNEPLALALSHAVTLALDQNPTVRPSYGRYSLDEHTHWYGAQLNDGRCSYETRPASANYAVRIETWNSDTYQITADVRNLFEDRPELGGAEFLQTAFNDAVENLKPEFLDELVDR